MTVSGKMSQLIDQALQHIPRDFFTIQELTRLLPGTPDSRYARIKRALAVEDLVRIKRGLYGLAPRFRKHSPNPYSLSQYIYGPSYISLESALSHHGWIPEAVYPVTAVSLRKSRTFETPMGIFRFARVPQRVLYAGVDRNADKSGNVFFMAHPLKALLDYLAVHKRQWTNLEDLETDMRIDASLLLSIPIEVLDRMETNYNGRGIQSFLNMLRKEKEK